MITITNIAIYCCLSFLYFLLNWSEIGFFNQFLSILWGHIFFWGFCMSRQRKWSFCLLGLNFNYFISKINGFNGNSIRQKLIVRQWTVMEKYLWSIRFVKLNDIWRWSHIDLFWPFHRERSWLLNTQRDIDVLYFLDWSNWSWWLHNSIDYNRLLLIDNRRSWSHYCLIINNFGWSWRIYPLHKRTLWSLLNVFGLDWKWVCADGMR